MQLIVERRQCPQLAQFVVRPSALAIEIGELFAGRKEGWRQPDGVLQRRQRLVAVSRIARDETEEVAALG